MNYCIEGIEGKSRVKKIWSFFLGWLDGVIRHGRNVFRKRKLGGKDKTVEYEVTLTIQDVLPSWKSDSRTLKANGD